MIKITNGKFIISDKIVENVSLYIKKNIICDISSDDIECEKVINAGGNYVSPGFIDIHVHGGGGYDCADGGKDAIIKMAEFHAGHGVTTCIPTMPAADSEVIEEFLKDVKSAMEDNQKKVNIYGAHLEGPYMSPIQCGALDPKSMRGANPDEYESLITKYPGIIKRWTYAPEMPGCEKFIKYLMKNDIIASMGHSDCRYEDAKKAYDAGSKLVTHLYSAMSTITRDKGFRKLGLIESALLIDDIDVELITDLCHLPKELIQLVYKTKGPDRICLITDAMRGAGMPDGESLLGGKKCGTPCIIEEGVAKLCDRSAFAGSVATADRLIRGCIKDAGIPLVEAVKMMTENPARFMNIPNKGSIQKGMDADIIIFDNDINIKKVFISGADI